MMQEWLHVRQTDQMEGLGCGPILLFGLCEGGGQAPSAATDLTQSVNFSQIPIMWCACEQSMRLGILTGLVAQKRMCTI